MSSERRCSLDISVDGWGLPVIRSGDVQFDIIGEPPVEPPIPPPDVTHNVLILYGGVISYTGVPAT